MDWLACICIVTGIWLVGRKSPLGFVCISLGAAISSWLQLNAGLWGLATQSVLVVGMNFWAFWKWKKKGEKE